MFALCSSMKWTHLPVAGGLYDQSPDMLDKFKIIFDKLGEHEREERKKEERKNKSATRGGLRARRR